MVDRLASYCVIGVSLICGVILIKDQLERPKRPPMGRVITKGQQLPVAEYLPGADRALLVVLSTKCRFCTESASFYARLTEKRFDNIVFVFAESSSAGEEYLKGLDLWRPATRIARLNLTEIGVTATPTLILLDRGGKVLDSWIGKLDETRERDVIASLGSR